MITRIPDDFVDIPMDFILIEQVLLNLLENAVFHAFGLHLVGPQARLYFPDMGTA